MSRQGLWKTINHDQSAGGGGPPSLKLGRGKGKAELVARNYLPLSNCVKCGQQATLVCAACVDDGELKLFCDKCAKRYHNEEKENEEHFLLLLANSPRSGVCGYGPKGPLDELF